MIEFSSAGFQILFLLGLYLVGSSAELGPWYFVGLVPACALMVYQQQLIKNREPSKCFKAFLNNAWTGGFVFLGIALAYYSLERPGDSPGLDALGARFQQFCSERVRRRSRRYDVVDNQRFEARPRFE